MNCLNYTYNHHNLSREQTRGVITLIRKPGKNHDLLSNYRPISLLNTDCKICAKSLANREKNVITCISGENATGFIKNRFIGDNIRFVLDATQISIIFQA